MRENTQCCSSVTHYGQAMAKWGEAVTKPRPNSVTA